MHINLKRNECIEIYDYKKTLTGKNSTIHQVKKAQGSTLYILLIVQITHKEIIIHVIRRDN